MSRLRPLCLILLALLCGCRGLGGEPEIVATFSPPPSTGGAAVAENWQPDILRGQQIFADNCSDCHGISGDGQGALVLAGSVSAPLDMTDRALTRTKSPLDWFTIISEGKIENLMPPWQNALSERERWDVTMYAYALGYDAELLATGARVWAERCADCQLPPAIPPLYSDKDYGRALNRESFADALAPEEIAAVVAHVRMRTLRGAGEGAGNLETALSLGQISGRVQHGSAGGLVPPDTVAQLQYGSPENGFNLAETSLDADGDFVFADIPLSAGISYVIGVIYDGRIFSRLLPKGEYEQTITIYDLTNDPAVISVAAVDLFLNPVQLEAQGTGLRITQIIRYRNESDRIFTSGRGFDDGREASLLLQFPIGAKIMSDDAAGRYVLIEDLERLPDSLIDTLPVAPGDAHEIIAEYFLPYVDGLAFEQAFSNRAAADITVMLPKTLSIESAELKSMTEGRGSDNVKAYGGRLDQDRDPRLRFQIAGDPFATSGDDAGLLTGDSLLAALAALTAAAVALPAGFALWRRRAPGQSGSIDNLAKQIAQLDDEHDRGQINHDLYHHRRRQLKAKLAELMSQQQDA
ncbi:MAG: cytochrome c [Chloroflexota bacterium]|nr:cytochrome c [Chloroflexota bacterium]